MPSDLTQSPPETIDAALSRIDAQTRAAIDAVERARAFSADLVELRGHGSADGVDVVVDHVGLALGVTYTEHALRTGPAMLARATMAALGAALDDALAQVTRRTRETWGDDPVAAQIVAEVEQRFAVVPR
ncbi:hypothetical protein [Nocardioides gilvus]|uniref:hypothetical protein n=1 Tax=Nocardioides gilvus TaxID=1735589 RepID=UPI0013A56E18|nr:hypothetical protein [Nocardioides gilvus]